MVPQTLRAPYWEEYIDRGSTEDGKNFYNIDFWYGPDVNEELKKAIFSSIPKKKRE